MVKQQFVEAVFEVNHRHQSVFRVAHHADNFSLGVVGHIVGFEVALNHMNAGWRIVETRNVVQFRTFLWHQFVGPGNHIIDVPVFTLAEVADLHGYLFHPGSTAFRIGGDDDVLFSGLVVSVGFAFEVVAV